MATSWSTPSPCRKRRGAEWACAYSRAVERTESMLAQTRPPGVADVDPGSVLLPGHDVPLGRYTTVRRLLPQRARRMVGAWCFVDHFGPDDVAQRPGMEVPPHPHTGLQTVTWLLDGEILHRDSLGNVQPIRPGQLNVMTSGNGIAHSERVAGHPSAGDARRAALGGAAGAGAAGARPTSRTTPTCRAGVDGELDVTVLVGEFAGRRSPARGAHPTGGGAAGAERRGAGDAVAAARFRVRRAGDVRVRRGGRGGVRAGGAALPGLGSPGGDRAWRGRGAGCCCWAVRRSRSRW